MAKEIDRRDLIKITASALIGTQLAGAADEEHKFLTAQEYILVDDLTEILIPADEHSGGAKAAKVADFIDQTLADAFEQEERDDFRAGLKIFIKAPVDQREILFKKTSAEEKNPKTAEGKFFRLLKEYTIKGYYTTKIGIEELEYKGNVYQTGEYAGFLPS